MASKWISNPPIFCGNLGRVLMCYILCQVFEVMKKQEQGRLAELAAEKANFEAIQAQKDIVS